MNKNQAKALDADLFEDFRDLYFDDYEYLAPSAVSKEQNKSDFLEGKIENPTFTYPKLEEFNFEEKEKSFQKLREKALKHENHTVREAYSWRIDEMLSQINMLKAAKESDDKNFTEYSKSAYGNPSPEIFEYDKVTILKNIEKARTSDNDNRIAAATQLENALEKLSIDKAVQEKFEILPRPFEKNTEALNSQQIKMLFEEALKINNIDTWNVIIDKDEAKSNFSANQEEKIVHIPNDKYLSKRRIKTSEANVRALIAHELTHVRRRENGEKSPLKLLGLGLDRFLRGDEGVATYNYQQIEGASDFAAFRSHFSVSLAKGLDGKPRNFREVFEILKIYLTAAIDHQNDNDPEIKAETIAWNTCIRCFRGTTCKTPGAVFTKGHVYREGNIRIYELVSKGSKEVARFMAGKYDPVNPRHTKILDELGI